MSSQQNTDVVLPARSAAKMEAVMAVGCFAIGAGEPAIMGFMPDIVGNVHLSEPQVGHAISVYVLGIMAGAPLLAMLEAKLLRKHLLMLLIALYALGKLATAFTPSYDTLITFRFISGLPQGAFFGIAAMVASSMVPANRHPGAPGTKKTHRPYALAYATSQLYETAAVVYDLSPSRTGEHAHNFLQDWKGKLVCDDYCGYKASFDLGVTEIVCMSRTRRKFFKLHATNKGTLAKEALHCIQLFYEIESEVRDLEPDLRHRIGQEQAMHVMDRLHAWIIAQRDLVPGGSVVSKRLKRRAALSRYLDDRLVVIDNNWCENQIRPWSLERKNWLFAGSLRSGQRATAIMNLIQSARLNGHDLYAYLKGVLTHLPTQRASEIDQLLPHKWQPV